MENMHEVCVKLIIYVILVHMDDFDRKILKELQLDGRLTTGELAERIGLSASQCSRRRSSMEKAGVITGYSARVDPTKVGMQITSIISIVLHNHDEKNAENLRSMLVAQPEVQNAYALTGEMDYTVKVISEDLDALTEFINRKLLRHPAVQNVRTSIVLDTIKSTDALPI